MVDNATLPGAPQGVNCLMSVQSYGSTSARVTDVAYSFNIGSTEDETASTRVYYPLNGYIPGYDLTYVFPSIAERDAFNNWFQVYMKKVSSNQAIGGYVYVQIPARNIAFNGIPLGPLNYGDTQPNAIAFTASMRYVGATSPISSIGTQSALAGVSQFKLPTKDTKNAPYFYPAGTQKSGASTLAGTLYDPVAPTVAKPIPTSGGPPIGPGPHEVTW